MSNEQTHKLPAPTTEGLRDLWMRAQGAAAVATVAQQTAEQMFVAYQDRMRGCLEMLGLDPEGKWWIDFKTGVLNKGEPPPRLSGGAKNDPVKADGASA